MADIVGFSSLRERKPTETMILLLLLLYLGLYGDGRFINVTTTDFQEVLEGNSPMWGPLHPGDHIMFPGTKSAPQFYQTSTRLGLYFPGTAAEPIIVEAEEIGGVVVNMATTAENAMDIIQAHYLVMRGLILTGGSNGLRLGANSGPEDLVSNSVFEDLTIHGSYALVTATTTPVSGVKILENITLRRIHGYGAGSNCINLGASSGGASVVVRNSVVEFCYCHDLLPSLTTASSSGAGLQVRVGSSGNHIRYNVFHNVLVGVYLQDAAGLAPNQVYGNAIWNTSDICVQVAGGAAVHDNILLDCGGGGISVVPAGLQAESYGICREVTMHYNTVLRAGGSALRVQNSSNVSIVNNVLFNPGSTALLLVGDQADLQITSNAALGASTVPAGLLFLSGPISAYVTNSDVPGDLNPPWPVTGPLLGSAADIKLRNNVDFNFRPRPAPADIGAYYRAGLDSNPGWVLQPAMRPGPDGLLARTTDTTSPSTDARPSLLSAASLPPPSQAPSVFASSVLLPGNVQLSGTITVTAGAVVSVGGLVISGGTLVVTGVDPESLAGTRLLLFVSETPISGGFDAVQVESGTSCTLSWEVDTETPGEYALVFDLSPTCNPGPQLRPPW